MKWPLDVYAQIKRSMGNLEIKGMRKIVLASSEEKACQITSAYQVLDEGLMIKLTLATIGNPIGGEVKLNLDGVGNHLSKHSPIDSSFPTYHLQPFSTID